MKKLILTILLVFSLGRQMKKLVLTILLVFSLITAQAATPKVIFEPYDALRQAALAVIFMMARLRAASFAW